MQPLLIILLLLSVLTNVLNIGFFNEIGLGKLEIGGTEMTVHFFEFFI